MMDQKSGEVQKVLEHQTFYREFLLDRAVNLQTLAEKRDLLVKAYSYVQLSTLDNAELKIYCISLHELLYSPPQR